MDNRKISKLGTWGWKSAFVSTSMLSTVAFIQPAGAQGLAEALDLPDELWIGGRLKQGVGVYLDRDGDDTVWGPAQFTAELQAEWTPNQNVTVISDFWLRGDWYYQLDDSDMGSGIQDFTKAPPFRDQFDFLLTENGSLALPEPYGDDGSESEFLDDFEEDVIRELSILLTDTEGRASLKLGKFQRGWGQADGLRLLDILNPQDLRLRGVFTDTEELRISQWSASLTLDMEPLGVSAPFQAIGMDDASLELFFTPVVRHSEFVINNPTPSSASSGGPFGFPFPALIEGQSGFGMPLLLARLNEVEPEEWEDNEIAARLKFNALGGQATLNAFYGFQDLPIIVNTGGTLHIGTFLGDTTAAGVVNVPLDLPSTIGAIHAPGQYVDFIQSLAAGTAAPGDFPLIPFGCLDILNPAGGGVPCSATTDFDLDYTFRQKTFGFSFTRDMTELRLGPKDVSPVLRLEASYEVDKPFNRGVIDDPFIPGQQAVGTPALISTRADSVAYRDQISVMAGFDFNVWVPGWDTQRSSIFTTTQFFAIHTEDADGLLYQAPYALTNVEDTQEFMTQTYSVGLFNDQVLLDGLAIWDMDKGGVAYRQRIDFTAAAGKLKPRIEFGLFNGKDEQGLLGLYRASDYVEFSLTYQF
ncbi:hypothetical protein [Hyphomonas sp.]|uniref:hypothetical protein n=1 Tax=Hyphomonas sp. TaxID=87 RepID=UPI0025BF599B|nr:hypothetical protein [Hyphomonas sp.]